MNISLITNISALFLFLFILLGQVYFKINITAYQERIKDQNSIDYIKKTSSIPAIIFSIVLVLLFGEGAYNAFKTLPHDEKKPLYVILFLVGLAITIGVSMAYRTYSRFKHK